MTPVPPHEVVAGRGGQVAVEGLVIGFVVGLRLFLTQARKAEAVEHIRALVVVCKCNQQCKRSGAEGRLPGSQCTTFAGTLMMEPCGMFTPSENVKPSSEMTLRNIATEKKVNERDVQILNDGDALTRRGATKPLGLADETVELVHVADCVLSPPLLCDDALRLFAHGENVFGVRSEVVDRSCHRLA